MDQWEREEEQLQKDYAAGFITSAEFNEQMRELARDRRGAAQEAAEEAYERELDRW